MDNPHEIMSVPVEPRWSLARLFAFRVLFVYFLLMTWTAPLSLLPRNDQGESPLPWVNDAFKWYTRQSERVIDWTARNIFPPKRRSSAAWCAACSTISGRSIR